MSQNNEPERVQETGNQTQFDKYGQVSIRLNAGEYCKLIEIQGLLMVRFKRNFTKAQAMKTTIDATLNSLKAGVAIEGIVDIEKE